MTNNLTSPQLPGCRGSLPPIGDERRGVAHDHDQLLIVSSANEWKGVVTRDGQGLMRMRKDGNGNVTMLVGTGSPTIKGYYRYDPFGRTLASGGSLHTANVMRFSSKPVMGSSDLYYYGYRFYDPSSQRWLNRDPLGEAGGVNLQAAFGNDPATGIDPLGLFTDLGSDEDRYSRSTLSPRPLTRNGAPGGVRIPILNPAKRIAMKPCGRIGRRAVQSTTIPILHIIPDAISMMGLPHCWGELPDGHLVDHGGTENNDHWTAMWADVLTPLETDCATFSKCVLNWHKSRQGPYHPLVNNCKRGALDAISACGGIVGNGLILYDFNPGGGPWEHLQRFSL